MSENSDSTEKSKKSQGEKLVEDNTPSDVAFLYKSMIQRDPNKRRVKPVEKHLMQIHFGMSDDDESDSDYEFKPEAGSGSDDGPAAEDVENSDPDSAEEKEEEELSDLDIEPPTITANRLTTPRVCCVCISSHCVDDEIVECDSCGVLVHEGCYGSDPTLDDDALSVRSDTSTENLEPWFCDACKAGVKPSCELCPNTFGILKQTDTGRWVHLICALYVPGVAFGNTQRLDNVTLLEMPYSKWGAKECCLCEDDNFAYSGVCIGCDAGMCRSFFHVTCAQREGLLSEANIDEEIADPFYAHCKMHGDKLVTKGKKRNFLALQSHVKQFKEDKENRPITNRAKRKLERCMKKFKENEAKREAAWVPPHKLPRAISSSASAVRSLMRKAELLGVASVVPKATQQKTEIVKKSFVAPALTVEFAGYFHQRNHKIDSLKKLNKEALAQSKILQAQEKATRQKMEELRTVVDDLHIKHEETRQAGIGLWNAIIAISSDKLSSHCHKCGICKLDTHQHQLAKCDQCALHYHLGCLDPPLTRMPKKSRSCGWVCSICDHQNSKAPETEGQQINVDAPMRLRNVIKQRVAYTPPELQLFVERDRDLNAAKRKHLPPRKRVRPKKVSSLAKPASPVVGRPRGPGRPRRPRPLKKPATAMELNLTSDQPELKIRRISPSPESQIEETAASVDTKKEAKPDSPSKNTETLVAEEHSDVKSEETKSGPPSLPSPPTTPQKVGRRPKVLETGMCAPCNLSCNGADAVRCDSCSLWFHFACLSPPVKKSPKTKGYSWNCDKCEEKEEEEEPMVT